MRVVASCLTTLGWGLVAGMMLFGDGAPPGRLAAVQAAVLVLYGAAVALGAEAARRTP